MRLWKGWGEDVEEAQISVIVAVYNIEDYIERCIKSIIGQTYRNLEIILIDDGSTDCSGKICDSYQKKDERIKVIHKKNGGLSSVRNLGSILATGKYLAHIDGDDFISETYFEYLAALILKSSADIAICDYARVKDSVPKKIEKKRETVLEMDSKTALKELLYQKHFTTSSWAKLFTTEQIRGINFPQRSNAEDMATTYKILEAAQRVVYGGQVQYFYFQRDSSIIHSCTPKRERDYIDASVKMLEYISLKYPDLAKAAASRCFSSCIQILMQIPYKEIYRQEHSETAALVKKLRKEVLLDNNARVRNRGCALVSYLGLSALKISLNILG